MKADTKDVTQTPFRHGVTTCSYTSSVHVVLAEAPVRGRGKERGKGAGERILSKREGSDSSSLKVKLLNLPDNFTTRQQERRANPLIQEGATGSKDASDVLSAVAS